MSDAFGPNPQDRFTTVDPVSFLPVGFTPVYGDPVDAQQALDNVQTEVDKMVQGGAPLNQVLDTVLGVVGKLLGVAALSVCLVVMGCCRDERAPAVTAAPVVAVENHCTVDAAGNRICK